MSSSSNLSESRLDYRAAAQDLADEAVALVDTISEGSKDLIDVRFASVRAAYAKCKGAHAELMGEPDRNNLSNDLVALADVEPKRMSKARGI